MTEAGYRLPWLLPAAAVALVVSIAASGAVARATGLPRILAAVLILSVGLILAVTLTPQGSALSSGATGSRTCDLSRFGLASLRSYEQFDDPAGNVLMFVPLGFAVGFMPRSRLRAWIVLAAILLPFAIEATQLLVPVLDRSCESGDVVDNLLGLAAGLALGAGAAWLGRVRRRPGRPGGDVA